MQPNTQLQNKKTLHIYRSERKRENVKSTQTDKNQAVGTKSGRFMSHLPFFGGFYFFTIEQSKLQVKPCG